MGKSFVILCCILILAMPAKADDIVGQASVIDGDTLDIHGQRIRLAGIDAPEHDQLCDDSTGKPYRCGNEAANRLADFIAGRPIICPPLYKDHYRRTVAVCAAAGQDLGEWLVRNGLAIRWPKYDREGRYIDAQASALATKTGLWSGQFLEPWDYRACRRGGLRPQVCSDLHP
jgi:endonuclease YncB( thermonuclease family)